MMFGSRVGFSGTVDLMVQLSNIENPIWQLAAISSTNDQYAAISRKR